MKVLMLAPEFLPVWGGVGTYVVEIAKNMPPDVEVHILTPARAQAPTMKPTEDAHSEFPDNVRIHHLGKAQEEFFHNFAFMLNCKHSLRRIINDLEIDLVHSESEMPDYLVNPENLNAPILTTIHTTIEGHYKALRSLDTGFDEMSPGERFILTFGSLLKKLEDRYYTNKRNYLTVSEWAKKQILMEKRVSESLIGVVHNGVDPETYNPSKENEIAEHFPELAEVDVPIVLYLSRMATRKGIDILLKAAPKILEKVDVHFVFAGGGRKPDFRIPSRSYSYLGYIPHKKPAYLYAISDIFVLPSMYENFPISILEAMASQCAVLATDICGIPEMIESERNGMLIPPMDVDAVADSIVRLAEDDKLRMSLGKEARKTVIERFSWKEAARRTYDNYQMVVSDFKKRQRITSMPKQC